jgi:hypothetical protein
MRIKTLLDWAAVTYLYYVLYVVIDVLIIK